MQIYVVEAQNLVPMPGRSSSNPFTTIYFGDKKSQTEIAGFKGLEGGIPTSYEFDEKQTLSPVWNEVLAL